MSKKKEVTVKQETNLSIEVMDWGAGPQLSSKDLMISKILPMQAMSKKVVDGEAVFGELRDSLSNNCYGTFTKPLEILPFTWKKVWVESLWNEKEGQYQYSRIVPMIPANENLPYEEQGIVKRVETFNFFALVPSELSQDPLSFPKILPFRVTSLKAGKTLATFMHQAFSAGLGWAAFTYTIQTVKTSNDKGTFAVLEVKKGRPTTKEEQLAAFNWYKTINTQAIKVDDSDIKETESDSDLSDKDMGKF